MQALPDLQRMQTGFLVLLVARRGEDALQLETRRQVYLAVTRFPGLPVAELSRNADLDEDLVRYHLRVLEKAGLVTVEQQGGHRHVHPTRSDEYGTRAELTQEDRQVLSLLRRPAVLRAVVALLQEAPLTAGDLADQCGVAASTMSHHIKRMDKADLLDIQREGRSRLISLAEPKRIADLLAQHPPPQDLVQGFIEAWDDLEL